MSMIETLVSNGGEWINTGGGCMAVLFRTPRGQYVVTDRDDTFSGPDRHSDAAVYGAYVVLHAHAWDADDIDTCDRLGCYEDDAAVLARGLDPYADDHAEACAQMAADILAIVRGA